MAILITEVVHLVQDEEQAGDLGAHLTQELHLDLCDRRIGRHQKQGRIALRQEVERCLGIVAKGRTDPWSIDEYDPLLEQRRGMKDLHVRDTQLVVRIPRLGYVVSEKIAQTLRPLCFHLLRIIPFLKIDPREAFLAGTDKRGDCRQGNDRCWKDFLPQESVE